MEMTTPVLSIIVPVYNVEEYLARCIDSVLTQTFTNFELILVDDGSPDRCGEICDEYARKDSRVIVIHKENGGVSSARNRGLDIARGEYITFVDSDDLIGTSTTYEENIAILKHDSQIDVLQYPILTISEKDGANKTMFASRYIFGERELFLNWYTGSPIRGYVWDKIFKKTVFNEIRFPEGMALTEDAFCIVDFVRVVKCLYISEQGYYTYILRKNSAISSFSAKKCLDMFTCNFRLFRFLCSLPHVEKECCHYFFSVYKDYLNVQIAYRGKIELDKSFVFIKHHVPDWKYVRLESDSKCKVWYLLFSILGIRFSTRLYIDVVLFRLKMQKMFCRS